ncbi:hypothetical protein F5Y04DRAFT_282589 [Hypomontagnella monticulosa]|nr:hypothetical protein F5Y04DRAFT_282589 [Hypomontagnella monticulosa]
MALPIASQDQVASGQSTPGLPTPQAQIASQEPVKINDKGFTVLSEGINPKYDIIMIHGFQGHPERTWLHKSPKPNFLKRLFGKRGPRESCYWPGELLPQDFKDCRVVVYGYDSDVVNFFSTASQATIFDHGRNLLGELEALRRKDANRPIIFIAHSLGGLILKEALRRSRDHGLPNASAPYLKTIYSATSAVVFMGTPHRGSDYADWGVIAQRIAAVAGFDATGRIIQDLRVDGAVLNKIDDDFIPLRGRFAIYTFQEARGVKGVQGLNDRVVLDVSSKLGSENEVSASIDANHMEMCRFSGFEDHGYRKLRDTIRGHIDRAELPTFDDVEKYMQSLKLEIGLARLNEVEPAHAKTFQWLFDHGNTGYDQWLQNDEPLFWVKGKAGSGKSTLMHFAYHDDRTKMALESYPYSSQGKVSSPAFFLHNRGSPLQKSLEGLLRTIIHRILTDAKELQGPVLSHASKFIKSEVSGWNMSALDAAVEAICKQALVPLRICLFVDALDEYSGNHEDIVKFLRGLIKRFPGAKTKLKICFSSRPLQIFLDRFGDESDEGYQVRGFDIRDHTKDDIKEYLSAQFQLNLRMRRLIASGDQQVQRDIKLLRNMILYKAEGVFLWVRLVSEQLLGILTDGDYRGNSIANLKDRLTELPNELDEFYQCIVDGVNLKYQNELSRIAQILLCTKRPPMSLQDFLAAFRCSLVPSDSTLEACLKEIKDAPDCESAERFVRSRSGGLIEIIRGFTGSSLVKQFGLDTFGCRVQFIHQSVKTFFQKDRGDNDHTLQSPPHFNGHLCLQRFIITCMANISEHTLRNMDSSTDTQNWADDTNVCVGF